MKDVAEKAGVHHSTISLCLKNSPRISQATKERVLAVVQEMGYRPHPYLSTLMHTRRRGRIGKASELLAFVIFSDPGDTWRRWMPELQGCLDQARDQAQTRGWRLEKFEVSLDRISPHRLGDILYARGIKGALIAPLHHPMETLDWNWNHLAVVALGPSLQKAGLHRVRHHHFQAMLTAMDECHRLGYRRVGFALREEVNRKLEQRWLGAYLLKQQTLRVSNPPKAFLAKDWAADPFLKWFKASRLDAVIAVSATETTTWLTGAGYRVPEDIGVVSLSSPKTGAQTGVFQDWPTQGKRAVTLLLSLLQDNLYGLQEHPNQLLVPGLWNPGKTVSQQLHPGAAKIVPAENEFAGSHRRNNG